MKNFFTLIALALMAVSASAADRTTLWTSEDANGTLITWGGAEVSISNFEPAAGDKLIVTVGKVDKTIDDYPQAKLMTSVGDEWTWTALTDPVQMQEAGEYTYEITADMLEKIASHKQVFFSGTAAYFTKVEFEAGKVITRPEMGEALTIWEGEKVFDSWSVSESFAAKFFAGGIAKEGDIIRCHFKDGNNVNPIFKKKDWTDFTEVTRDVKETYFQCVITADALTYLAANGFLLQGVGFTLTKVELYVPYTYQAAKELTLSEGGNIFASEFEGYSDNAKVTFTYTVTGSDNYKGWGNGTIYSIGQAITVGNHKVNNEGDNQVEFVLSDLKDALSASGFYHDEENNVDVPMESGLYWHVWGFGDGACTTTRAKVTIAEVEGYTGTGFAPNYTWTVVGVEALTGSNWNLKDTSNDMTSDGAGNWTLVKEDVTLEANVEYGFKVARWHTWSEAYPTDNQNKVLKVSETGKYKVTFKFNASTKEVSYEAVKTGEAEAVTHTYRVIGTLVGGWADENEVDMTETESGSKIYTATIKNVAASETDYEYKVRADHAWTIQWPTSGNYYIKVPQTSDVTITLNLNLTENQVSHTIATGISTINVAKRQNAVRYNLAGQKVDESYKGVAIENGKKFVVK